MICDLRTAHRFIKGHTVHAVEPSGLMKKMVVVEI